MIKIDNPKIIEELLAKKEPIFINRLGGSDAKCLCVNYSNKKGVKNLTKMREVLRVLSLMNGYYDMSKDPLIIRKNLLTFFDRLDRCYKSNPYQSGACICADVYNSKYKQVRRYFRHQKGYYFSYREYIERAENFLQSFQNFSKGKKILLINPFTKEIKGQVPELMSLYSNKINLDCTFKYLQTPITYFDPILGYIATPHNNFLETVDHLCKQIDAEDYDIALLGCGSYAHFLGEHIKGRGKKAIYVGGVLPTYFGLMSDRTIMQQAFPAFFDFKYVKPLGGVPHSFNIKQESLSMYLYHPMRYKNIIALYSHFKDGKNVLQLDEKQSLLFFIYSIYPYSTNPKLGSYLSGYDYDKYITLNKQYAKLSKKEIFLLYLSKIPK